MCRYRALITAYNGCWLYVRFYRPRTPRMPRPRGLPRPGPPRKSDTPRPGPTGGGGGRFSSGHMSFPGPSFGGTFSGGGPNWCEEGRSPSKCSGPRFKLKSGAGGTSFMSIREGGRPGWPPACGGGPNRSTPGPGRPKRSISGPGSDSSGYASAPGPDCRCHGGKCLSSSWGGGPKAGLLSR